ncbi:hypothetical protein MM817_02821 [Acidibacillus sp. S0AB]|uniref:Uncharacterized protein n=1 Tax=Sulfoacidibacillus ferrooxidans TaxID=2005001 RepID=A0A9X2AD56_9BACL|nr:hypothetical protein [Sulfoacidibacillus ferrooxidans]
MLEMVIRIMKSAIPGGPNQKIMVVDCEKEQIKDTTFPVSDHDYFGRIRNDSSCFFRNVDPTYALFVFQRTLSTEFPFSLILSRASPQTVGQDSLRDPLDRYGRQRCRKKPDKPVCPIGPSPSAFRCKVKVNMVVSCTARIID